MNVTQMFGGLEGKTLKKLLNSMKWFRRRDIEDDLMFVLLLSFSMSGTTFFANLLIEVVEFETVEPAKIEPQFDVETCICMAQSICITLYVGFCKRF